MTWKSQTGRIKHAPPSNPIAQAEQVIKRSDVTDTRQPAATSAPHNTPPTQPVIGQDQSSTNKKTPIILVSSVILGIIAITLIILSGGGVFPGFLLGALFIAAWVAAAVLAVAFGIVTAFKYLYKRWVGRQPPKWLTTLLFVTIVITLPLAYNALNKSISNKHKRQDLAAISFNIFEPTTIPNNYKRASVMADSINHNRESVEFIYFKNSAAKTASDQLLRIDETNEGPNTSKICNYKLTGEYTYTYGGQNASDSKAPVCEHQTTPKGIIWYHDQDQYQGERNDFAILNGTRVTIRHFGLTNEQLDRIFDGLVQKKATDIEVNDQVHDVNFLGIHFQR